jgi:dephospho-CoA kinase
MNLVVAIAGKMGSGKTTLSKDLAAALSCPRAAFGDYVRQQVQGRGLPLTRENLQVIGTELLLKDSAAFCDSVIASSGWHKGLDLVIDGLRHLATIPIIRRITEPSDLKIVYISVTEETRLQRLSARGEGGRDNVTKMDSHSSEQELASIAAMADITIPGDEARHTNVSSIRNRLENLQC